MKPLRSVVWLSWLIAGLSVVASGVGLFWKDAGSPFVFTTARGEIVQMYGQGLYRYESLRNGAGFKGVDLFMLVVAIPLLILCTVLYRRGSLRGTLLLTGTLAYFLYNSVHLSFSYAYNDLFLVYVALLSASLFAMVLAFSSIDALTLPARFSDRLPRRAIASFLLTVGASLMLVWIGLEIVPALMEGRTPQLSGYTTLITVAVDVGILVPLYLVAGVLLLRRAPLGYLLAATLLVVSAVLGAAVVALSAAQVLAGALTVAETLTFVVPFIILTLVGIWLTTVLLGDIAEPESRPVATLREAHA